MNQKEPFVLCLTNTVAANFTANALLAIGAKPAMVEEASEAAELAAVADAVLINVGTLTPAQAEAMRAAVRVCRERGVPWVLDPVAVHALAFRRHFVYEMLEQHPTLIRGNQTEVDYLLGSVSTAPLGTVPAAPLGSVPTDPLGSVPILATGETDRIYVGTKLYCEISGGIPMLQSVTATGCAQGAIAAAYLARAWGQTPVKWGQTPLDVCINVSKLVKRAGEIAFNRSRAPGSFQINLLDALYEQSH